MSDTVEFPKSPKEGDTWQNPVTGLWYVFSNGEWELDSSPFKYD